MIRHLFGVLDRLAIRSPAPYALKRWAEPKRFESPRKAWIEGCPFA